MTMERGTDVDITDFIKLPAGQAAELYRECSDAGDAAEASRMHQAYFEAHRIRLSADRQVAEATAVPMATVTSAQGERSRIRRVGLVLSVLGLVVAGFSGAAGIGVAGLAFALAFTGVGFALWLAGIVEDRLIEIRCAISAAPEAATLPTR